MFGSQNQYGIFNKNCVYIFIEMKIPLLFEIISEFPYFIDTTISGEKLGYVKRKKCNRSNL